MNTRHKLAIAVACLTLQFAISDTVWARGHGGGGGGRGWGGGGGYRHGGGFYGGRIGFGFGFGPGVYWPSYYYWPNYYWPSYSPYFYPPVVTAPSKPPVYVERSALEGNATTSADKNWQYCASPDGFFPHVKECAGGWQTVSAQPDGQPYGYWYYCAEPAGYYPYVRECSTSWQQLVP